MDRETAGRRGRRLLLAICVPLALLSLAEVLVRVTGMAPPPGPVTRIDDPANGTISLRCEGIETETPRATLPFRATKPQGTVRVVLFGESAAAGFPYLPASTPARWLELRLRAMLPDRHVEVLDAAISGINSDWIAAIAERMLAFDPDVYVVYAGNNEFLDPYVDRRAHPVRTRIRDLLHRAALLRWIEKLLSVDPMNVAFSPPLRPGSIDTEPLGATRNRVLDAFRANIERLTRDARARGIDVLLVNPAVALRGWSPRGSEFSRPLDAAQRARFKDLLARATRALHDEDPARARPLLDEAAALDPDVALLVFRQAELLEAERAPGAAALYRRALELDRRPNRATGAIRDILRDVARATGATFFDMQEYFEARAPDGVVGSDAVIDHCHLSVESQYHMTTELVNALHRMDARGLAGTWRFDRDPDIEQSMNALGIQKVLIIQPEIQIGMSGVLVALHESDPEIRSEELYRARNRFETVLRRDPRQARALSGRALVRLATDNVDGAVADLNEAARLEPEAVAELAASLDRFRELRDLFARAGVVIDGSAVRRE